jgi:glycosyltransferase involved in cell wall biosynthesis
LRVLTFTSLFPNSTQPLQGVFIYQRLAHLARRPENTVQVVAPVPYFPRWVPWTRWQKIARVPRKEQVGELTVYHPRYFLLAKISMPLHGLFMFLGCVLLARRLNKESRFDCIDAHFVYPDGLAAVLIGKVLGLPVVVSARGTDIELYPAFSLIRPLIVWTLAHAAGVLAVSGSLKAAMVRLGVPAEKIQVIANGVDVDRFQPVDRIAARRQLGLPEDASLIVSVGSLLPVKCHERLISAVAQIKTRHPRLKLYIVGEGPSRPKLEELIRDLDIHAQVVLVGSRSNEELKSWFSAANVSCLVSSREGWPNVLSESIACGTPVVATRVGGVSEIIRSPELGILVEPNTLAIAAGIEDALTRSWDQEALVRHARRRTWDVVAAEVENYLTVKAGAWAHPRASEGSQAAP